MTTMSSPNSAQNASATPPSWFRGFIQGKTRIVSAWVFAIAVILSARHLPTLPGIVVCFLGATVRFWASGYLRKDSRPAVGGPYAFVRNPLYLGTYLMAVGVTLAVENYILLAALSVLYAVLYHYIILDEETKLERIFGAPYLTYKAVVPRFFPRVFPPLFPAKRADLVKVNPEPAHAKYDWALSNKNKAYEAYATFAALIGFVAGVAMIWQRFGA